MDGFLKMLERDGKRIGADAAGTGEKATKARSVIEWYKAWHKCPGDNMSRVMCEEAYKEWSALTRS